MKPSLTILLFVFFSLFLFSCAFAPINTQYEKAGTLKKGNLELAGSFTGYSGSGLDGESGNINNNYGIRAGYGISDKFDLKFRYERLIPTNIFNSEDLGDGKIKGINYFSLVPKIALIPEKLSFLMPISHYSYKEEIDEKESNVNLNSITPQLIYTFTNAKNKTDLSFGLKGDCLFGGDVAGSSFILGTTIGAGFSSDLSKWAIRPEIGVSATGTATFLSYGIGFQFIIQKRKN